MSPENTPILDINALKEYLMVETNAEVVSFLKDLIPVFEEDTKQNLAKLKIALTQNNKDEIRLQSHSLKSCSRNLALKQLAETCGILESASDDIQQIDTAYYVSKIERELLLSVAALKNIG